MLKLTDFIRKNKKILNILLKLSLIIQIKPFSTLKYVLF